MEGAQGGHSLRPLVSGKNEKIKEAGRKPAKQAKQNQTVPLLSSRS